MEYINEFKDIMMDNSPLAYVVIFIIGFISSLSPHMLSMAPIFMSNAITEESNSKKWIKLCLFCLSFAVTLTILGIVVSTLGSTLHTLMKFSYIVAGGIYIYIGLSLIGIRIGYLIPIKIIVLHHRKKKCRFNVLKNIGMSLIFTPCSLPFVISILTLAMVKGSILYGGLILFSFGLGHSLIFFLLGISSNILLILEERIKFRYIVHKVIGLIMIMIGLVFFYLATSQHIIT